MTWPEIISELKKDEYTDLSLQEAAEALTEALGAFVDKDSVGYARSQIAQQAARGAAVVAPEGIASKESPWLPASTEDEADEDE